MGRLDHVLESADAFRPRSRLETTVWIDHQMLDWDALEEGLELVVNEGHWWNNGGVNVVRARTDILGVTNLLKGQESRIIAASILDRVDIHVKTIHGIHTVSKLAVTHVRVNLGFRCRHCSRQPERIHSPREVFFLLLTIPPLGN
jgi:hypothetical protein